MRWITASGASVLLGLLTALAAGKVELREDPPPVPAPKPGTVRGSITPAGKVRSIAAVSRHTLKEYRPASFDKDTGRFAFADLPGDAAYDLRVTTADGRTIEGIDLSWIEARMVRLAAARRKQLGLPPERARAFTEQDANAILKWVADWKDFMEIKRVLYLKGHGKRATVLVELLRTREFHAAKGALVWRVELWYFRDEFGGWDRLPNAERVLHRERIMPAKWRTIHVEYYPELSAYIDPRGQCDPVHFKLPAEPDLSRGRPAGTPPEVETKPHILGVEN